MSNKNLVIVESPAKAKTIAHFLNKDFSVKSSFGHIRDLPKKGLSIDTDSDFKPDYEIPSDKKRIVSELKKQAKSSSSVWLASDDDREGEAIAWHLAKALDLPDDKVRRIVFHEITKPAVEQAIANPRNIDNDLVNAQQARRVLDRLVGYELSPILWKKIRAGLSAGRVQSVAVRLIVERERQIKNFKPESNFKVSATFIKDKTEFEAELKNKLKDEKTASKFLEACKKTDFSVVDINDKPSHRNPSAPLTTSTLQQEAARKLGFSVKQTMTLAQRLYENGHITYMRTDSTMLSKIAINSVAAFIENDFGKKYLNTRQYQTRDSAAQEAHEAIRPTHINIKSAGQDSGQQKLYKLIWRRLIASQMSGAQTLKTEVKIGINTFSEHFIARGEVLKFDGFLKVYGGGKEDAILPKLSIGDMLTARTIDAHQTFSRPPARYSEASLVKALEEMGIGRPSTYAPTISTIQSRGYIEKTDLSGNEREAVHIALTDGKLSKNIQTERFGADNNKLLPTHLADVTTDFLVKYFGDILDYNFTAEIEKQFDEIAGGKLIWQKSIKKFYGQFHPCIDKANKASRQEASQAKLLGKDPATSKPIFARFSKYGPMLQKGEVENKDDKPVFAPLPADTTIDSVTLEQALTMFSLPRKVGKTKNGKEILSNIGRFGPYIKVDSTFVSIKPLDPFNITEKEALKLYSKKLSIVSKKEIKKFDGSNIQVLKGPYGPYVTDGSKNAKIPSTIDPASIDLKKSQELLNNSKPPRKRKNKR